LLAAYGLTFLACDAEIFAAPRRLVSRLAFLRRMLACHFCTGIWTSTGLYLLYRGPHEFLRRDTVLYVLAGAAIAYVLDRVVLSLELYIAMHSRPPPDKD
jgi:hypothetical protein